MNDPGIIGKAVGYDNAARLRRSETIDIAVRRGVLPPDRLFINGFPASHPAAVFNPGHILDGDRLVLFPRIILGYYKYVSAIAEAVIPLEDVLDGTVGVNTYSASLAILPSNKYDLWGAEDPRAYRIGGLEAVTYTGRTRLYFESDSDKTLPITAFKRNGKWVKSIAHKPSKHLNGMVSNDKNAFLVNHNDRLYLFHRPQLRSGEYLLLASLVDPGILEEPGSGDPVETEPRADWEVIQPAGFEEKIAWGPPPIHLSGDEYLFLLHGVGKRLQAYRVFAALIELPRGEPPVVKAVTPRYIMEPREAYEVYGDRPYTVFPCGASRVGGELLVTYGAADYMAGFATISMDDLMAELDKGRIN